MTRRRDEKASPRMMGSLFRMVRWLWLVIAIMAVSLFVLGIGPYVRTIIGVTGPEMAGTVFPGDLEASYQVIESLGLSPGSYAIGQVALMGIVSGLFLVVAGLIYWRRSVDRIGLLAAYFLLFMGMTAGQMMIGFGLSRFNEAWAPLLVEVINTVGWNLFFAFVLLFPDGRFVPRWTRWLLLLWIVTWILQPSQMFGPPWGEMFDAIAGVGSLVVAALAQIYRYRRVSTRLQRQQTKWVALGLLLFIGLSVVMYPFIEGELGIWFETIVTLLLAILPLSIGIAILRAGLWDVDLIIRKTLLYGTLTVLLALLYFGGVILIQSLFTAVVGQESAVAIVLSTLIIAALFIPLRSRVQTFIDRRFYRRKYDAALTLSQFAQTARDEVDLERLAAELVRVVEETMQPQSAGLWLRQTGDEPVSQKVAGNSAKANRPSLES